MIFESWHAYFLLSKLKKFQTMHSILGKNISGETKRASKYLIALVVFDISMTLAGLLIYLYAFTFLTGSQLNSVSAIGATLGESHCLTSDCF